jgi:hypothetical protein
MSGEPWGEELLESPEHEQLYQQLSEVAFGHSCRQVFGAALRLACVAGFGLADGEAEDNPECRPEALQDAVRPLLGEAVRSVLAGLKQAVNENGQTPAGGGKMGRGQDGDEMARIRDLMVAAVIDAPKRLVHDASVWIAADAYTAGAEAADLLRRAARATEMQRLYSEMLEVGKHWRLRKQAEQN